MNRKLVLNLAIGLSFFTLPTHASTLTVDLAKQSPGSTLTLSASAFPTVEVRIINRVPKFVYNVTVIDSLIPIEPLKYDGTVSLGVAVDPCKSPLEKAKRLNDAESEGDVAKTIAAINLEVGDCKDPQKLGEIRSLVGMTMADYPGSYVVKPGHQLTVTVTRNAPDGKSQLTWITIVRGEDRGLWLTTYGAVGFSDKDELFFAAAAGDKKFNVTKQNELKGYKVTPSVFFTWLSRDRQESDLAYGPTAGFGVKDDKPAVFAGYSFTYNWNLGLVLGFGLVKEARLNGKYKVDQVLTEALDEAQLHKQTFQLRPFIAVTFRFGSNPFEGKAKDPAPAEKAKDSEKGKDTKGTTK